MKGRKLKIGMVSMHIVASWGKDVGDKIKESLPDGTLILKQNDNFDRATLDILLYGLELQFGIANCRFPLDAT